MNDFKKEQLLSVLKSVLGDFSTHSNYESSFMCPFCHHHKKKLDINLLTQNYHCWVCNSKGKSLYRLMKVLGADNSVLIQIKNLVDTPHTHYYDADTTDKVLFQLPAEFKPMWSATKTYEWKHALKYLYSRGVTKHDIIKYNIGYCDSGVYKNFIIIPSYNKLGILNYFVARNYYLSTFKYKNPNISKDVVIFENTISWNLPIVLTEGVFDAIAIKRNAIPLLGKVMRPALYESLLLNNVKEVYVVLDNDAKRDAIKIVEQLQRQHIRTHFVGLGADDPSDLGFSKVTEVIKSSKVTDFTDLIKLKFT